MTTMVQAGTPEVRWGWLFAAGVVLALLGLGALGNLVSATLVTTALIGFLVIIAGGVEIFAAFAGQDRGGWRILHFVLGVVYIVVGIEMVADPLKGAIALTVVIGLMLLIDGGIKLVGAFMRRSDSFLLMIVIGILDLILGLWVLSGIPYTGVAIGFFVGLMLLMGGIGWMVSAWMIRSAQRGGMAR